MSIAASVLIRPSSCLRLLLAAMALLLLAVTPWLFLFAFPTVSASWRLALVFPCAIAAFGLLHASFRTRKWFLLDICGLGRIRLREHYTGAAAAWLKETNFSRPPRTVRLLEGSTFWPGLLALRLRDQDGKTTSLLVLPDSVAPGAFRALSLSLRWIASQDSERAPMHNEF
jgi:toxin CptA